MKFIELQTAFELEIDKLDDNITKPTTSDIEYWLMVGLDKFIKTRYTGNNFRRRGFEQDQKRMDDLRTLIVSKTYTPTEADDVYTATIPSDYMFTLGETAVIYSEDPCWSRGPGGQPRTKHVDVLEATIENVDRQKQNSLSEHRLHANTARPLRLLQNNTVQLHTDGNYKVKNYIITYLKTPNKISLTDAPFSEWTEMPAATHSEIVKLAVEAYLENKANPRYQSYINEVSKME